MRTIKKLVVGLEGKDHNSSCSCWAEQNCKSRACQLVSWLWLCCQSYLRGLLLVFIEKIYLAVITELIICIINYISFGSFSNRFVVNKVSWHSLYLKGINEDKLSKLNYREFLQLERNTHFEAKCKTLNNQCNNYRKSSTDWDSKFYCIRCGAVQILRQTNCRRSRNLANNLFLNC